MNKPTAMLFLALVIIAVTGGVCGAAQDYLQPVDIWEREAHWNLFAGGRTLACPAPRADAVATFDFNGASFWPMTFVDPNAKDWRVEDGVAKFTMGADKVRLGWGNYEWGAQKRFQRLTIPGDPMGGASVVIRLRQSLPQTTWAMDFRYHGDPLDAGTWAGEYFAQPGHDMPDIPVARANAAATSDWQEITAPLNGVADADGAGLEIAGKVGNEIAIDWIKVIRLNASVYARKVYTIPGPVSSAKVTAAASMAVYVNGKVVRDVGRGLVGPAFYELIGLDLKPFLHPGRNVIALSYLAPVQSTPVPWMQGAVQTVAGETIKIGTGLDWKCSTAEQPGWLGLKFDDSKWVAPGDKDPTGFLGKEMRPWVWYHRARLPNYSGQMDLQNPYLPKFYYNADDPRLVRFVVRLPAGLRARRPRVEYAVWSEATGKQVVEGVATGGSKQGDSLIYDLTLKGKLDRGVYSLVLDAAGGTNPELHRQELFVVVGKIPMPETEGKTWDDGLKATLVDEIKCADPNDSHPFADAALYDPKFPSRIVTRNGLTYREAPFREGDTGNQTCWLSWTVTFKNLGKPHYIIIDYPDDLPRLMQVQIHPLHFRGVAFEGTYSQYTAWTGTGVQAGGRYPNTGQMQELRFIVWSHEPKANLLITRGNWGPPCPGKLNAGAAVARIRVYEIEQLPALKTSPAANGRRIGVQNERPDIEERTFGGVMKTYSKTVPTTNPHLGWFTNAERFAQYCRFAGFSTYFMGSYQYIWPPEAQDGGAEGASLLPDLRDMYINVLGANGITTYSSIEYRADPRYWARGWTSLHQALAGKDFMMQVDRQGTYKGGAYLPQNVVASKIGRQAFQDNIRTIVTRFSIYPSWQGLSFIYAPGWEGPCYDNANMSFDDQTIRLFEKETGIKIPVDDSTTRRFPQRYQWIMANAKEQWFDWRSRKLAELHEETAKMCKARRADLEYAVVWEVLSEDYSDLNPKNRPVVEIMRDSGSDPRAYLASKVVNFTRDVMAHDGAGGNTGFGSWQFLRDPELVRLLNESNSQYRLAFLRTGFEENRIMSMANDPSPKWWGGYLMAHVFPAHRYVPSRFVTLLVDSDIDTFEYGFCDCYQVTGAEQELRQFNRVLVSLPRTRFTALQGNGLDRNLCIKESKVGEDSYLLIINPAWWEVEAVITVEGSAPVTNTVDGKQVKLGRGNALAVTLPAYGIACFKRAGSLKAVSAKALPSQEATEVLKARLNEYGNKLTEDAPPEAKQALQAAQAAWAQGDLVTCWYQVTQWPLYQAIYLGK